MSKRVKIGAWIIVSGCFLFFLYGLFAAVFNEATAAYEYSHASGKDFASLTEEVRYFSSKLVLVVGSMGAGLALCSGVLFWIGFFKQMRLALISAVIGGGLGLAVLITIHLDHRAWILFIVDNVCLNVIGIGFGVGGREVLNFILRGSSE